MKIPYEIPTTAEEVEREEERQFLAEVERRAGASREEMMEHVAFNERLGLEISLEAMWLRRILWEEP